MEEQQTGLPRDGGNRMATTARPAGLFLPQTAHAATPPSCHKAWIATSVVPLFCVIFSGFIWLPTLTLYCLSALVMVAWLPVLMGYALRHKRRMFDRARTTPAADSFTDPSSELPKITILLPLYNEANMLHQLAEMLHAMNYPAEKLECLVLLEADDTATALASLTANWPRFVRIISVPDGQPRTKARACNYGLRHSCGDFLVIFDAEDLPHPMQFREAAAKFAKEDASLACLQAPLQIIATKGSWRQAQFALEYWLLFEVILPGLSAATQCLPLGGSSNYFIRDALQKVGGWDDHNLTEDADLALRLAHHGYRIATLRLATLENAPHRYKIWHRPRTRWLSGHLQTLHTHGLHFFNLRQSTLCWRRHLAISTCFLVLSARLMSGLLHAGSMLMLCGLVPIGVHPVLPLLAVLFYAAFAVFVFCKYPIDNRVERLTLIVTHPAYWLMTFPAFLNAVKRMLLGQTGWLKSPHKPYLWTPESGVKN